MIGPVAQLDRASRYEREGEGFKSLRDRQTAESSRDRSRSGKRASRLLLPVDGFPLKGEGCPALTDWLPPLTPWGATT